MSASQWVWDIARHERRVYSQGTQDGVLEFIFHNVGEGDKFCIEFGFNSNTLTGGSGPNVAHLVLNRGWKCLLLYGTFENSSINLHREFLTSQNLASVFAKYHVPAEPDYVSIDVDSCDLWLFRSLLQHYKPRVVTVEYNAHFPLDRAITFPDDPSLHWNNDRAYGASLLALYLVGLEFNYVLVHVVRDLDAFFVRGDLVDARPPLSRFASTTGRMLHLPCTTGNDQRLLDYAVWKSSGGDATLANEAAHALCKQVLT